MFSLYSETLEGIHTSGTRPLPTKTCSKRADWALCGALPKRSSQPHSRSRSGHLNLAKGFEGTAGSPRSLRVGQFTQTTNAEIPSGGSYQKARIDLASFGCQQI